MSVTGFNHRRRLEAAKAKQKRVEPPQDDGGNGSPDADREALALQYEQAFGKKPQANMKASTIAKKLLKHQQTQE